MTIPDAIWSTPTSTGKTLGQRVSRKPPATRVLAGENLDAFVKIWNDRLMDALETTDRKMEEKARLLLEFLAENHPTDFTLLLWGEFKLSAVYNNKLERIFLIE